MKTLLFALLVLLGTSLAKPLGALAQYPLHVDFHLTGKVQEPFGEGPEQTFRTRTITLDNAKILELLGTAMTNDFTGADLAVDHSGLGFSVVRGTNVLADVSTLLSRKGSPGMFVVQGKQTNALSFNVRRETVVQYQFMPANAEHSFTFWAHEQARIAWRADATNAPPQYFEKAHAYGFGEGQWGMMFAEFTGTVDSVGGTAADHSATATH